MLVFGSLFVVAPIVCWGLLSSLKLKLNDGRQEPHIKARTQYKTPINNGSNDRITALERTPVYATLRIRYILQVITGQTIKNEILHFLSQLI